MKKILQPGTLAVIMFLLAATGLVIYLFLHYPQEGMPLKSVAASDSIWTAPSLYTDNITAGEERALIIYGEDLIVNTSKYFGPLGTVSRVSNGMNCQNCHLDAGTRQWGNNYAAVFSTYPKFRQRSGAIENIYKRVNDCFERSLNGKPLDTGSYEMKSIFAYLKWLGKDVPKNHIPTGTGLQPLPYLDRAADPQKGNIVYIKHCQSCHGLNGEGVFNPDGATYLYPPVWGENSYNDGAGLFRVTKFAAFVKNNMPFNLATHDQPTLTDEEAWDVAAFINTQPRPHFNQSGDWRNLSGKSVDEPFGPYTDSFTPLQHKYGPYQPILDARKNKQEKPLINK